jgi:hypothetical protein
MPTYHFAWKIVGVTNKRGHSLKCSVARGIGATKMETFSSKDNIVTFRNPELNPYSSCGSIIKLKTMYSHNQRNTTHFRWFLTHTVRVVKMMLLNLSAFELTLYERNPAVLQEWIRSFFLLNNGCEIHFKIVLEDSPFFSNILCTQIWSKEKI